MRKFLRRCFRWAGWWLSAGAVERWNGNEGIRKFAKDLAAKDRNTPHLESIRVHTWLSKEFEAIAFEDRLLEDQLQKYGPLFVAKHNAHMFSQTYEDAAIAEIFSRIGTTSRTFIEIGTGDGSENTTRLLLLLGWKGLWIEGDGAQCEIANRDFRREISTGQLQIINATATPDAIQRLIDSAGLGPDVDLLSVDIDMHTSHLFRAVRTPSRVACVEYNAHVPPTIDYEVPYRPGDVWDGSNWFGASLKTLEIIGAAKGMSLVGCDLMGVNAYFVDRSLVGDLFPKPFSAEYHFQPARYQLVRGQRGHSRRRPPN